MPRSANSPAVTVEIGGETIELHAIKGVKNASVVMDLISLASEVVFSASRANINLSALINSEEGFNFSAIKAENLLAFKYVADMLVEKWDRLVDKVFPVLLGKDVKWMEENGSPFEYYRALGVALNLNAPHIFGDKTWTSLKKLLSGESDPQKEEEDQPVETD